MSHEQQQEEDDFEDERVLLVDFREEEEEEKSVKSGNHRLDEVVVFGRSSSSSCNDDDDDDDDDDKTIKTHRWQGKSPLRDKSSLKHFMEILLRWIKEEEEGEVERRLNRKQSKKIVLLAGGDGCSGVKLLRVFNCVWV